MNLVPPGMTGLRYGSGCMKAYNSSSPSCIKSDMSLMTISKMEIKKTGTSTYSKQSKRLARVAASGLIEACSQLGCFFVENIPIDCPAIQNFQRVAVQTGNLLVLS
mmetsp:Transcript_2056/g.4659  ORF Transcript_2056/g.4659 Transcript_2056/m.4659 type:complete len:106 (-) Transcript_2056:142-459(-)